MTEPLKIHPRHIRVEMARRALSALLDDWQTDHELTLAEVLMLLSEELHEALAEAVKSERLP